MTPKNSNPKYTAADAVFSAEPWTVPWTAKTILQRVKKWNMQQNHLQIYQTLSANLPKFADLDPLVSSPLKIPPTTTNLSLILATMSHHRKTAVMPRKRQSATLRKSIPTQLRFNPKPLNVLTWRS
ncbi:uncharacterized protein LOC114277029 isoform X3 [Camellia sinensis]|nr:uncharacterized protein LOC114277029 isoform X3 [Camellia sinensis]